MRLRMLALAAMLAACEGRSVVGGPQDAGPATPDRPDAGGNRGAYANAEVDRLIDQGRITTERDARAEIYRQIQRILAEELPYLSLWHEDVVALVRRGLDGYQPLPNASLFMLWQAGWEG